LLSWRLVLRRSLIAAVLAVLLLPAAAAAQSETVELMPGVTYTKEVRWERGGPLVVHSIVGPRPGGLYALRPILSNDLVLGRETVSAMQRRLSTQSTSVGVNGDYFSLADGRPSGIFMRDGVLVTAPNRNRSSAGITLDGLLDVRRVRMFGTWRGLGQRRRVRVAESHEERGQEERVLENAADHGRLRGVEGLKPALPQRLSSRLGHASRLEPPHAVRREIQPQAVRRVQLFHAALLAGERRGERGKAHHADGDERRDTSRRCHGWTDRV